MLVSCSARLFEPFYTGFSFYTRSGQKYFAGQPWGRPPPRAGVAHRASGRQPTSMHTAQHSHRGGVAADGTPPYWLPSTASASRRLGPRRTVLSAPPSIDHDCHRLAAAGRRRTRRDLRDVEVQAAIRHRVVDEPDLHVRQQEGAVGQVVTCKRRQLLSHTAKAR